MGVMSLSIRNRSLIACCVAAALLLPLGLPAALGDSSLDPLEGATLKRLHLDLGAYEDQTRTLAPGEIPTHLPSPAAATNIGPGSRIHIYFWGQLTAACTAGFIFQNVSNGKNYLSAAGHCFLPEEKTSTHGAGANWGVEGTGVKVCVSSCNFGGQTGFILQGNYVDLGPLAYARQKHPDGRQLGYDFGVVEIPWSLNSSIRYAMPVWDGPTTSATVGAGSQLCHYGYGAALGEAWPTAARTGVGAGSTSSRWWADLAIAPGDSGSALQTCGPEGTSGVHGIGAVGVVTHLVVPGVCPLDGGPATCAIGQSGGTPNARGITLTQNDAGFGITLDLGP